MTAQCLPARVAMGRQRPDDRRTVARLECAVGAWTFEALVMTETKGSSRSYITYKTRFVGAICNGR
jgi:hypothetical protein